MRRALLALLLLLPACLEYEITVETVVQPDGSSRRTVSIKARDGEKPADAWRRMKRPGDPYAVEGDPEKGFVASARLPAGRHPSALRVLLGGFGDDAAEAREDLPVAEGTADVRAVNLIVGTLYRYEERIALGTDPARFREDLPRWLDIALRLLLEAMKTRFPDIDFAPVEARARTELLPAVERAIENLHHAASGMLLELGPLGAGASPELLARSEFWPAVVRELKAFGVDLPEDGDALQKMLNDDSAEQAFEGLPATLAERLVAPLPEERRAEVKDALLEAGLDGLMKAGTEKLYPEEEAREKLERECAAFAASALGAYTVYGLFDSFDLRFRLELPGKLLRTNGDLARLPAVEWRLGKGGNLFLVPPVLYAYSFLPAKGAPDAWDMAALGRIDDALANLTPDARAAVEVVVAGVLAGGKRDETGLEGEAQEACRLICEALDAAKARVPK